MARHTCIVPGCRNEAPHAITLRLRRPDTSAMWAPNTDAYLCDNHASEGAEIEIVYRPRRTRRLELSTRAEYRGKVGDPVTRSLPITQGVRRQD